MRVMVIVKASEQSEAGEMPSEEMLSAMGAYNDFGDELTPELREQEERLRKELQSD